MIKQIYRCRPGKELLAANPAMTSVAVEDDGHSMTCFCLFISNKASTTRCTVVHVTDFAHPNFTDIDLQKKQ